MGEGSGITPLGHLREIEENGSGSLKKYIMETTLVWYENPVYWATTVAALAAAISAGCAWYSIRKTTREKLDIVKADILILVSKARGSKEFEKIFMPSPDRVFSIDESEVSAILSKTDRKYRKKEWSEIMPAAFEELSREKFEGF